MFTSLQVADWLLLKEKVSPLWQDMNSYWPFWGLFLAWKTFQGYTTDAQLPGGAAALLVVMFYTRSSQHRNVSCCNKQWTHQTSNFCSSSQTSKSSCLCWPWFFCHKPNWTKDRTERRTEPVQNPHRVSPTGRCSPADWWFIAFALAVTIQHHIEGVLYARTHVSRADERRARVLSFPFSRCSRVAVLFAVFPSWVRECVWHIVTYDIYSVFGCEGFCVCVQCLRQKCDILMTLCQMRYITVHLKEKVCIYD